MCKPILFKNLTTVAKSLFLLSAAKGYFYQAVSTGACLYQTVLTTRRDVKILSWPRHIEHCLQLIYRAVPRRVYLLFVGGPMYQGSQSFICTGGYTQHARLSVVPCIVHGSYLSHAARGETRHDITKPILYCRKCCPIT